METFVGVKPNPTFHISDLCAPAVVARATKFGRMMYYDRLKHFRVRSGPDPHKGACHLITHILKHIPFLVING